MSKEMRNVGSFICRSNTLAMKVFPCKEEESCCVITKVGSAEGEGGI